MTSIKFGCIPMKLGLLNKQTDILTYLWMKSNISRNPFAGKAYSFLRKGYYRSNIKSHFIFYRVNSTVKEVEIIRILHQQMDIENRLDD